MSDQVIRSLTNSTLTFVYNGFINAFPDYKIQLEMPMNPLKAVTNIVLSRQLKLTVKLFVSVTFKKEVIFLKLEF